MKKLTSGVEKVSLALKIIGGIALLVTAFTSRDEVEA